MSIEATGVEGDHNVWPHPPQLRHQRADRLIWSGLVELAIDIVEEADLLEAQRACRQAQLGLAHPPQRRRAWVVVWGAGPAVLAARGRHQIGRDAFGGVSGQDAARPQRFVVGVGQDAHQLELLFGDVVHKISLFSSFHLYTSIVSP
jgi:hypothetical protein